MTNQELEKRWLIWDYVSMSWSEIGIEKDEFLTYFQKIERHYSNWQEIEPIVKDVLLCFAPQIPFMFVLFPIAPDWGYNKNYLIEKIQKWQVASKTWMWLNPLRLIGYPLAHIMAIRYIQRLRQYYQKSQSNK